MPEAGHGVVMKECRDIRELLSAMLDSAVTPTEQQRIDRHLAACPRCREALAELEKTVALLRQQERVEPPPWLTTRIMARIAEEAAPKPTFWQRLFQPWPVKVPLQALALVALCITGYYLTRENLKQVDFAAPAGEPAPTPAPAPAPALEAAPSAAPPTLQEQKALPPTVPTTSTPAPAPPLPAPAAPEPPPRAKSAPVMNEYAPAPPAAAPPLPEATQELRRAPATLLKSQPAPAEERAYEAPAAVPQMLRDQAPPPAAAKRRAAKEESAGAGSMAPPTITLRLTPVDPVTVGADIAELSRQLSGNVIATHSRAITLQLPVQRYQDFLAVLARFGTIAATPTPPDSGVVQITVRW